MLKPIRESGGRKPVLVWPRPHSSAVLLGLVHLLINSLSHRSSYHLIKLVLVNMQITKISLSILQLLRVQSLK